MAGTWQTLINQPTFGAGTMLLLTDGSVLCHDESNNGTNHWYALSPDSTGDYRNGTWRQLADGPNSPLYFACSVLADGRVFVAGGEYNNGAQVELLAAEIYDPLADSWTTIPTPTGWTEIGDAPSVLLPDGRVLLGDIGSNRSAIYDPVTNAWTAAANKEDSRSTEETWVLLGDQTVLAIECDNRPRTEKYVPAADLWVTAGATPVTLVDAGSEEVGAAMALPDGRVFAIGATNHTALYTPPSIANQPGTWAAGPDFPVVVAGLTTGAKDAPAALLPNGRVLAVVAPYDPVAGTWGNPLYFYEFDPAAGTLTQVPSPVNGTGSPFTSRLMLLPTGQVLHTDGSSVVAIYSPDGTYDPTWRPSITSVGSALQPGSTYTLHGRQLNGLSQAVIYGDEGAMATNYPIVRITHIATGTVTYCRTHDHSTMGIQTGAAIHTTRFTVPSAAPLGGSSIVVIANGIPSESVSVAVTHKRWKELKWEIKEIKENFKLEHENLKLVFEDLRKISEIDGIEHFGDQGWEEVTRILIERSDAIESEVRSLRSFVRTSERPEVGTLPDSVGEPAPAPRSRAGTAAKASKVTKAAPKGSSSRGSAKKAAPAKSAPRKRGAGR